MEPSLLFAAFVYAIAGAIAFGVALLIKALGALVRPRRREHQR